MVAKSKLFCAAPYAGTQSLMFWGPDHTSTHPRTIFAGISGVCF